MIHCKGSLLPDASPKTLHYIMHLYILYYIIHILAYVDYTYIRVSSVLCLVLVVDVGVGGDGDPGDDDGDRRLGRGDEVHGAVQDRVHRINSGLLCALKNTSHDSISFQNLSLNI